MLEKAQTLPADHLGFAYLLGEALNRPGIISEAYRAFHRYSVGNQILAALQLLERGRNLSPIASFNTWKERRRYVKKGERALALWMPVTTKREDEETKEVTIHTRFALRRNWFSLEQTDGEPFIPEEQSLDWDCAKALEVLDVCEVSFSSLDGNIQGYAMGRTLAINPLAALKHKTRFHELAHIVLGHTGDKELTDTATPSRALAEVEAEATAFLLCAILNLPGLDEARGYIQHWLASESLPDAGSRRIFVAANAILKAGAAA
jgi:hypothetical protein